MKRILWNGTHLLKRFHINDKDWLNVLDKNGVVLLSNIKPKFAYMSKISKMVQKDIYNSIYGDIWDTTGCIGKPTNDLAYSSNYLPPHTDLNYLPITPKYQILCCEKQSILGGETILVDGFTIKAFLKKYYPIDYSTLTKDTVLFKCSSNIHYCKKHIISENIVHHNSIDMVSIKNNAYELWNKLTLDPLFSINYLLSPNETLIIDNHRVLHGRQSFNGFRNIIGCYLN